VKVNALCMARRWYVVLLNVCHSVGCVWLDGIVLRKAMTVCGVRQWQGGLSE